MISVEKPQHVDPLSAKSATVKFTIWFKIKSTKLYFLGGMLKSVEFII